MNKHFQTRALLLLLGLALLLFPRIADACAIGPKPTVLDAYKRADVVIIARAISVEKVDDQSPTPFSGSRVLSTTMEVQKVFKGTLRAGDKMTFGQGDGIYCTWIFYEDDIGKEYLFYLETPPKGSALWYEFGFWRSGLISRVADDLLYLNNIEAVRGKTRVSGTVDPGEDERDVAGKKIWIMTRYKAYETTTDKNGVYEFYDLPPGRYVLEPELPAGWKIDRATRGTTTITDRKRQILTRHIVFTLEPKKHAAIDISFVLDNVVSGSVVDAHGKPLPEVEVSLKPTDAGNDSVNFGSTDEKGRFAIESIEPGTYVLVLNEDGEKRIEEPFPAVYYPNVTEESRARVFRIRAGDSIKGLKIIVPNVEEMVTVQGVVRFADGTPAPKDDSAIHPGERAGYRRPCFGRHGCEGTILIQDFQRPAG